MPKKKQEQPKDIDVPYTLKQQQALTYLLDNETKILTYGGSKGGGKTYLGAYWMLIMARQFPGSRGLIGREELIKLRQSTLVTLFKICKEWGYVEGTHYTYNQQLNVISFSNGSEIILMDLKYTESDAFYSRLGGIEISHAWVDESQEITARCKNILITLIRYKIDDFKILPKLLLTCNPDQSSFLYSEVYKPWREGKLSKEIKYLPALPADNPTLPQSYIDNLKALEFTDPIAYKKFWLGLWEYETSSSLVQSEKFYQLFSEQNRHINPEGEYFLSCDIARLGADSCVYILWRGLTIVNVYTHNKQTTDVTASQINNIITKYNIQLRNVIIDEGGISGGVIDQLPRGIISFNNQQKAITGNYKNLKHEALFKLAEMINGGFIKFNYQFDDINIKNRYMRELEQLIQNNVDSESKLSVISKDQMKLNLNGKSPDYLDATSFRMFFLLQSNNKGSGEYHIYTGYIN